MGLLSLARRRWYVTSRSASGDPWTVTIGPEHFTSRARATRLPSGCVLWLLEASRHDLAITSIHSRPSAAH